MKKHKGLIRVLTLKDAVAVGLGAVIGAGIFVVTGVAAGVSGPAFIVSLIIAGIVASFNALSSAQLASVYPHSGGTYEYGYRLLNSVFGFSAGWMFLISKLSAAGVVAIGFGSYFYQLVPLVSPLTLSILAIIILTVANYFGVRKVGRLNLIIVSITLLSLLYLIFRGVSEVKIDHFKPFAPFGVSGIAEATALLFFAFTGYARIATLAEEVSDPQKTIPKAIIITITTAILLYAAVSIVAIGVIGTESMARSKSPLQEVANALSDPVLKLVVTVGACTAMLGVLLSQILGISRVMLAMGRRKDIPQFFQYLHPSHRVPYLAVLITGIIILMITIIGSFEFIVNAAAFSILLYYSITNLAALKQPREEQIYGKVVPFLGLLGCLGMSLSLSSNLWITGVCLLLLGFILRYTIHRFSKKYE